MTDKCNACQGTGTKTHDPDGVPNHGVCPKCGGSGYTPEHNGQEEETSAFLTIEEIKAANRDLGHHFFERGTVGFFNSRIFSTVYGGRWFVTGERYSVEVPFRYSIREARADGSIETVGEFQAYSTYAAAITDAERLEAGESI